MGRQDLTGEGRRNGKCQREDHHGVYIGPPYKVGGVYMMKMGL